MDSDRMPWNLRSFFCKHTERKRMLFPGCKFCCATGYPAGAYLDLYSVPPIRHGIITNDYMPPVRPIRGLAEQLERADKTCAAFYGWEPMRHVWTSGNMKYSFFVNEYEEDNSDYCSRRKPFP